MFQQCVRWKQVAMICILSSATILCEAQSGDATNETTTTEVTTTTVEEVPTTPTCRANEFILITGCATCHCRPDCPCDPMKGCAGSQEKCRSRCAVGYAVFPSCQFEMKTPGIDAVTWRSEAPNTVKFFINKKPDSIPQASGWYRIRCVSSLPPHSESAYINLNNDDGISFTDMTSASYYCYITLTYSNGESLEGPAVAVTPCTGWKLPTKKDLIVTTYFELRGKHRIVLNVKFPKPTTDCYDDGLNFPPTYDIAVRTRTQEVVLEKSVFETSDFYEIVDEGMKLSADTAYTLTLSIYEGDPLGEVSKEFTTTSFTPPYVLTSSSNYSQPKPGNVVISFPVWNWTDNKGNVAPDSYTVRYRVLDGTDEVAGARAGTTITDDVVRADIPIRHPGLTFHYVIECTVTSYGTQYTTPSPDSRSFQTQICREPSPFKITGTEFSRSSPLSVELEVSFTESDPQCAGRATYELLSSRGGVNSTTTCSAGSCSAAQVLEACSKYNITVIASNQASLSTSSNTEEVTTPVKVPSEPSNLRFDVKEKPRVKVFWDPPTATYCPVQGYKISVLNTDTTEHIYDEKNVGLTLSFTFTGEFYTEYEVTVRPVNEEGDGAIARKTIKVPPTTPGPPRNISVSTWNTKCINVSWVAPDTDGGIIEFYVATCYVVKVFGNSSVQDHKMTYNTSLAERIPLTHLICKLLPGSQYKCSVAATNSAGSADSESKLVWTEPNKPQIPLEPRLISDKFTATTVTLFLPVADRRDIPASAYFIGIEVYLNSSKDDLINLDTLDSEDFGSYDSPKRYITAKLDEKQVNQEFVIGNGREYGGYDNRPLIEGQQYTLYYGVEVKRGGRSKQTFVHSKKPFTVEKRSGKINPQVVIAVVASVVTMLIVFVIIVIIFVLVRKRRGCFSRRPTLRAELIPLKRRPAVNQKRHDSDSGDESSMNLEPIPVSHLKSYIISHQEEISKQCRALPTGFLAPHTAATEPINKEKNRFANILPYDKTRVVLSTLPEESNSDYINACYIEGYNKNKQYIAASGPKPNTCADFWRMVYEKRSTCIVMVTKCVEEGKVKCEKYWPDDKETIEHGDLVITSTSTEEWADFTMKTFNVRKEGDSKPLTCHHFLFLSWPDHGVPRNSTPFLLFRRKVKSFSSGLSSPLVIHCSAGVGRTGTFIAIDYLLDQAETEKEINVFHLVQSMRNQRVSMVQTIDQYHYIYQAVCEALETKDFYYSAPQFQDSYLDWNSEDITETQFEALAEISAQVQSFDFEVGNEKGNIAKNQNPSILPHDMHRAYIVTEPRGYSCYINAVFINSYRKKNLFIATQMPLPHTVDDYLRLLFDQTVQTVVALESTPGANPKFGVYLPEDVNTPLETDLFTVTMTSGSDKRADIAITEISLTYKQARGQATRTFQHIQANFWRQCDNLPARKELFFTLLEQVEKSYQRTPGNTPICIQCRDGNERTGLLLSIWNALDRLKTEQEVDVYHTVELIRMIRPQAITNTSQYKFVYEMLYTYLQEFDLYANYK